MRKGLKDWAPYAVGLVATLLFVDLFLGWHHVSVSIAGNLVDVDSDSSGWAGWGAIAGVLLIVLLVWEGLRLTGAAFVRRVSAGLVTLGLSVGAAGFALVEFLTGTVDVNGGGVVLVGVHGRQWPAYVGLVLAGLLLVAAIAQLERPVQRHSGRLGLGVR